MAPGDLWQYDLSLHGGQLQQWFQGLMIAATTDNVAVSALAAVSRFGLLIPLSRSARIDVEKAATISGFATVKFLRAKIGFSSGDAADHLAQSDGGVRFLGLAVALLCTSDKAFAGAALDRMLQATRSPSMDDRALPTNNQLVALVEALEPKLSRSSFAESVVGWQIYLGNLEVSGPDYAQLFMDDGGHPSVEMLHGIVSAFRHIDRIGEIDDESRGGSPAWEQHDTAPRVEISTRRAIPWITAFTKWLLGLPPSIRLFDGTWIVRQDMVARVEILVTPTEGVEEEVRIVYSIKGPTTLWKGSGDSEDCHDWRGMLPISDYGKLRLLDLCSSDQESLALQQALSYSLPRIVSQLWPADRFSHGSATAEDSPYHPARLDPCLAKFRSSVFPDSCQILRTFQEYTGARMQMASREGSLFLDPVIRIHEEQLAKKCSCGRCSKRRRVGSNDALTGVGLARLPRDCCLRKFRRTVATVSTEILSLSLFDCSEPVRMFWPGRVQAGLNVMGDFLEAAHIILQSAEESADYFCCSDDIIGRALTLVGHDVGDTINHGTWIASASRGQVFYPVLFDTGVLSKFGVFSLGGGLGKIMFGRDTFDKVISRGIRVGLTPLRNVPPLGNVPPLVQPLCLFQDQKLDWQVKRNGRDLSIDFGPTCYNKNFNPSAVLETAAKSLFVSCGHPLSRPLKRTHNRAHFSRFLAFFYEGAFRRFMTMQAARRQNTEHADDMIEVIAVSGNEPLRLFGMTSNCPGVLRFGACLECCLDVCTRASLPYIVL